MLIRRLPEEEQDLCREHLLPRAARQRVALLIRNTNVSVSVSETESNLHPKVLDSKSSVATNYTTQKRWVGKQTFRFPHAITVAFYAGYPFA